MPITDGIAALQEYWAASLPWGFVGESVSYEEKRQRRYALQDYMHDAFRFERFADKRVLEVGCGAGIDAVEFARYGARVTAVDFTETAVRLTKDLFAEAGFEGDVRQADATALPFGDGSFDCVYAFGVLHHIPDVDRAVAEIARVLKPEGMVLAMLYHRDSLLYGYSIVYLRYWRQGLVGKMTLDEVLTRYSERREGNPYTKVYTKDEAKRLFLRHFGECAVLVRYNVVDLLEERKVKVDVPDKYELGWHLIIEAVK